MGDIAKRRLDETWREAVEARVRSAAEGRTNECLARFDELLGSGASEAEAAYRTLSRAGLLWRVEAAGFTATPPRAEDSGDAHEVPTV